MTRLSLCGLVCDWTRQKHTWGLYNNHQITDHVSECWNQRDKPKRWLLSYSRRNTVYCYGYITEPLRLEYKGWWRTATRRERESTPEKLRLKYSLTSGHDADYDKWNSLWSFWWLTICHLVNNQTVWQTEKQTQRHWTNGTTKWMIRPWQKRTSSHEKIPK